MALNLINFNKVKDIPVRLRESLIAGDILAQKLKEEESQTKRFYLKALEVQKQILDYFNASSMEEIRQRIKIYSDNATRAFSYSEMRKVIEQGKLAVNEKYRKDANEFIILFNEALEEVKISEDEPTKEKISEIITKKINDFFYANYKYESGRGGRKATLNTSSFEIVDGEEGKELGNIIRTNFSKGFLNRLNFYFDNNIEAKAKIEDENIIFTGKNNITDYYFMLYNIASDFGKTEFITRSDFTAIWEKQPIEKQNLIVKDIQDYFCRYVETTVGAIDPIFIQAIEKYINKDTVPYFFVGKNVNDITGLFGEIQAIYFLYCLFDGNVPSNLPIFWIGQQLLGDSKPRVDIVINDLINYSSINIQVKNTILEQETSYDIRELTVKQLEEFLADCFPTHNDFEHFMQIFLMKSFNIEFQQKKEGPVAGSNPFFRPYRVSIEHYAAELARIAMLLNPQIINLQTFQMYNDLQYNDMFFFATEVLTAAEILEKMLDFNSPSPVGLRFNFNIKGGMNIVTYRRQGEGDYEINTGKLTSYYGT